MTASLPATRIAPNLDSERSGDGDTPNLAAPKSVPVENLYEVLGVQATDSDDVIKRAYFRKVRQHRPDDNPEEFKRFKSAYDVLSDTVRRRAYDQLLRYGAEVETLMREAKELEAEPHKAIRLLKKALVMAPDQAAARLQLSAVFLKAGEYRSAENELRRLLVNAPGDAALHYELGYALWMQERGGDAEDEIAQAIALNPLYHDAFLLLAHIYQSRKEISRAVESLEKAIQLNGIENFSDLPVLVRILTVHIVENNPAGVEQTEKRIQAVCVSPEEIAAAMNRLIALATDFHASRNYTGAWDVIQRVRHPDLRDPLLITEIEKKQKALARAAEAARITQDMRITGTMQSYLFAKYLAAGDQVPEKVIETIVKKLKEESTQTPDPTRLMLTHLREKYPLFSEEERTLMTELVRATTAPRPPAKKPTPPPVAPGKSTPRRPAPKSAAPEPRKISFLDILLIFAGGVVGFFLIPALLQPVLGGSAPFVGGAAGAAVGWVLVLVLNRRAG